MVHIGQNRVVERLLAPNKNAITDIFLVFIMSLNNTTCDYLSADEAEAYVYTSAETIGITVVLPVISGIGILLNSAFLFTVYRVEDMRTTTNIYLANLAVADEMFLVILLAKYLGTYLYLPIRSVTPFTNRFICGIPTLLIFLFSFASVFFISLVAFERYMAICRPAIHRQADSRTRAFRLSLVSWLASLAILACHSGTFRLEENCIVLPTALNAEIYFRTCRINYRGAMSMNIIDVCKFLVACIGNITLYICIVRRLNKRKGRLASQERNHVAKMLAINACVFFICLVPFAVRNLIDFGNQLFGVILNPFAIQMLNCIALSTACLNSAINPLIYNAFNPDYRKAFRRAFICEIQTSTFATSIVQRRASQLNRQEGCSL